jgi:hypothetical protein
MEKERQIQVRLPLFIGNKKKARTLTLNKEAKIVKVEGKYYIVTTREINQEEVNKLIEENTK